MLPRRLPHVGDELVALKETISAALWAEAKSNKAALEAQDAEPEPPVQPPTP